MKRTHGSAKHCSNNIGLRGVNGSGLAQHDSAVPSPKSVPYSDLVMNLQSSSVSMVLFEEGSRRIFYNTNTQSPEYTENTAVMGLNLLRRFSSKTRASTPEWQYSTRKIDHDENFLLSLMREKGTTYSSAPQSMLMSMRNILITVLSLWIPLTPLMWLLYRQLSSANSPAKKRRPSNQMVSFDDVEGVDTAKVELMEVRELSSCSSFSHDHDGSSPQGPLTVEGGGSGKVFLLRAISLNTQIGLFSHPVNYFGGWLAGRRAIRVRGSVNAWYEPGPGTVFLGRPWAFGGPRGRSGGLEEMILLLQLLTEMDGFESDMKVVVIAATNRPEALDPALCRPGRFSRKVFVGEPDEDGRRKILAVHFRGVPLEEEPYLICNLVASVTQGFVGADLANIVNEAALLAARRGGEVVTREDIMEAIERAKFGINDRQLSPSTISKELGKLFPWMPSLMRRNDTREDGLQGPLGYQTLS
ncbi:hypothetical protein HHK36_029842 [Tetracentron sinense]|uniref:Cell division protein n=1 Tax=Tetracentron sinense TaxID=13715 RepID=A0A834YDS2_TETSI|nr:hypothetical protein HHK36_029842 [Tetracentron sinense]